MCSNPCGDNLINPHGGIGEAVMIDRRPPVGRRLGHSIWSKAGCGYEVRRLTPVETIGP